tara:strand:+ start:424 stop:843 length:420 start_codon:yes stop_codon:yes gene_type:complete
MENIKIIKLENGDDIVCSFPEDQLPESHALLRIIKPLQIKYIPQLTPGGFKDYVAMVKWAAYTSDKVITIPKQKIMTITNATHEMGKSYGQVIKNYDVIDKVPEKEKNVEFKRERLSDQDNEKINEIFDEFNDEEPTIH